MGISLLSEWDVCHSRRQTVCYGECPVQYPRGLPAASATHARKPNLGDLRYTGLAGRTDVKRR